MIDIRVISPITTKGFRKESDLCNKYTELISSAQIDFRGNSKKEIRFCCCG